MISRALKSLLALNQVAASCAAATLILVTLLLLLDVILRALYQPLLGTQEIAEMAMVVILFGALSLIEEKTKQIRVDLLSARLGPSACLWIDRLSALLAACLWTALGWSMWQLASLSSLLNLSSNLIGLPRAPFQYLVVAMAALAAMTCATKALFSHNGSSCHDR